MLRSSALLRTVSHVRASQAAGVAVRLNRAVAAQSRLASSKANVFTPCDQFLDRHIGPKDEDIQTMLKQVGFNSLSELVDSTVPRGIRLNRALALEEPLSESEALQKLKQIVGKNNVLKSFIGMGYYETSTPGVILRNMLENPGWYTAYTPYQAEIAQGRLEMLLNFQTMVADLTGMALSNASLLDEATAAAEAMSMAHSIKNGKRKKFFVAEDAHPQNIALLQTRGEAIGVEIVVGNPLSTDFSTEEFCGAMVQYPSTFGDLHDYSDFVRRVQRSGALAIAASDLLALTLIKSPGEMGFDVVVGSSQRFGVPMGFGGPHAAFLATSEAHSRKLAGRIIGVSIDSRGKPALRMAMQTREQHIRRDKATSNICTAQALLANMAAAYAIYHGPEGVKNIARRVNGMAVATADALKQAGFTVPTESFFDTFVVDVSSKGLTATQVQAEAEKRGVNVRVIDNNRVGLAFGETITQEDVENLLQAFGARLQNAQAARSSIPAAIQRESAFLTHPVFNSHHSETQMLRYLKYLENKDLALNTSMISLGSCTMKLNATVEMIPITWNEICNLHPFAPNHQWVGMKEMIESLNRDLAEITGFAAVSAQPNSGAQGEYAGLLAIRNYLKATNQAHRNVCLIPVSAHGTNPASAAMAGLKVVVVKSDAQGNVDFEDLVAKAQQHADSLACLMITYPSTYGVFEERVRDICDVIHQNGGLVYMDGANMNAQVGLTAPGFIGADVCHLNLHKTFCIPHGGGGPGVGAIGVVEKLAPFLPGHPVVPVGGEGKNVKAKTDGAVSAAQYGSAAILPISWMYIKMMGATGLVKATSVAILNANYMASRLRGHYDILYKGTNGQCAHEFIVDLRPFKQYGLKEEDVAKRLQDYGFHSPTMSWPVPGTLMVEPTESEDKAELDRFVDALISIRQEIEDVVQGRIAPEDSPLTNAPHTMDVVMSTEWNRRYTREVAAFPAPWTRVNKFWPSVGRVDNVYGDRNLVCSCPPIESYMDVPVGASVGGQRSATA